MRSGCWEQLHYLEGTMRAQEQAVVKFSRAFHYPRSS